MLPYLSVHSGECVDGTEIDLNGVRDVRVDRVRIIVLSKPCELLLRLHSGCGRVNGAAKVSLARQYCAFFKQFVGFPFELLDDIARALFLGCEVRRHDCVRWHNTRRLESYGVNETNAIVVVIELLQFFVAVVGAHEKKGGLSKSELQ